MSHDALKAAFEQGDDPPADLEQGPEPIIAGTFAIYEDGRGGYVLVTDTDAHGTLRKHIPSALVKMVTGGAGFMGRVAGAFGGR